MHACNHCCSGGAISITHSECVSVALGIQHAMCMCHIMSSVACLAGPCYSTLSLKKVKQSRYRPGVAQKVKVPRFHDNSRGWW